MAISCQKLTWLDRAVPTSAFEPTCSLVLISPATQEIEVQSQNQTHFSQSPYSDPRCALDLPDNKRPGLLPIDYHAFIQNGELLRKLNQASITAAAIVISMSKSAAKQLIFGDHLSPSSKCTF